MNTTYKTNGEESTTGEAIESLVKWIIKWIQKLRERVAKHYADVPVRKRESGV